MTNYTLQRWIGIAIVAILSAPASLFGQYQQGGQIIWQPQPTQWQTQVQAGPVQGYVQGQIQPYVQGQIQPYVQGQQWQRNQPAQHQFQGQQVDSAAIHYDRPRHTYGHRGQYNTQSVVSPPRQPAQSSGRSSGYSGPPSTGYSTNYAQPIGQVGGNKNHQGVDYGANAGIGFDHRKDNFVGGQYDTRNGGIVGAGGSVGAGLYGDAGVSQSGKIGNVDIRNYAEGTGFVGTEAGAQAGISKKGVELGANGFAGGRVSGTVGSDIGPVGYGGTAEAWSGVGLEAGVNGGFNDGKLRFGAEAGGALGVGGKLGFQAEVDVHKIGNGVKDFGQNAGQFAQRTGQNIGNGAKNVGRGIGNGAKNVSRGIGNTAKKAGKGIGNAAKGIGNGAKKFFKGLGK